MGTSYQMSVLIIYIILAPVFFLADGRLYLINIGTNTTNSSNIEAGEDYSNEYQLTNGVCHQPVIRKCIKRTKMWTYDKNYATCFPYSGCKEGSGNQFNSKAECEKKCMEVPLEDCERPFFEFIVAEEHVVNPNGLSNKEACKDKCEDDECVHFSYLEKDSKCYHVMNYNQIGILPLESRDYQYNKTQCQTFCKRTKDCVQFDWREQTLPDTENTRVYVCMLMQKMNQVIERQSLEGKSVVGNKDSCGIKESEDICHVHFGCGI